MEIVKDAKGIFQEIGQDDAYKNALNLYDTVKRNNNFYHDKQWEGVNAPNLDKPVFNILKPSVKYFVGQLVSDDIGIKVDFGEDAGEVGNALENLLQDKVGQVFEWVKFNHKTRQFLTNAAVDGDGCIYWYWDTEKNRVNAQIINNTDVVFGDAANSEVEEQPYIILKSRRLTAKVREEAKQMGCAEWAEISANTDSYSAYNEEKLNGQYTDVAMKFWKENGTVRWLMCTREIIIKKETDLMITHYPIAWMPWEKDKNSYHGISPMTGQINNQIFVNKIYAMAMEYQKSFAFPKILYDATIVPKWSNKVGQAIAVNGNPQQAMFASFAPSGMNQQAVDLAESTIGKTKDSLGVYDAALGNVKPDNTSAIIAVQQASAQPLEVQKLDFYQAVEDCVYIIIDFIRSYEPQQVLKVKSDTEMVQMGAPEEMEMPYNLSQVDMNKASLQIEVGASSYWSELIQVQTLDNLLQAKIIPDAITYLECMPNGYVPNKQEIIKKLEEQQKEMEQAQAMQAQAAQAGQMQAAQVM